MTAASRVAACCRGLGDFEIVEELALPYNRMNSVADLFIAEGVETEIDLRRWLAAAVASLARTS